MLDISIVNETSPEANWNRRADRQAGRQADRQGNLCDGRLRLQKFGFAKLSKIKSPSLAKAKLSSVFHKINFICCSKYVDLVELIHHNDLLPYNNPTFDLSEA